MRITLSGITKRYDRVPVLDDVSLDITSGELIALLGPSGSGKTTLLRVIAGLALPDAGKVRFAGEDVGHWPIQKRRVGFVFQHYALFRHMRVLENVAFGLRVRRKDRPPAAEIEARARNLLELVQLPGLERRFPSQLSGGQRQRVALARALAIEPRVLLLDEPFGALDAQVRHDLRRWLRDLHGRTGHTTVFVTHDQEEALELADRVVVMRDGRIEQVGTPDQVFDEPASPFVFQFVGDCSRLEVVLQDGHVLIDDRPIGLSCADGARGPADLLLRPQHLRFATPGHPGIVGVVTRVQRSGTARRIELAVGSGRQRLEVSAPAETLVEVGRRLTVVAETWRLYQDDRPLSDAPSQPPIATAGSVVHLR